MSKSYIVIQQFAWCNESSCGIDYASDSIEFDKRHKAIKHGFVQQGSDDFNIGVIENGLLVSFDWMDKPIGESAEKLAVIAEAIGYEGGLPMSNIDKRALREAAERAGQNDWEYVYTSDLSAPGRGYITVGGAEAIYCLNKAAGGVKQSENVLRYIAAASPETMLALLNEIAELEQRHCGTALLEREEMHTKTLVRMLDELDAKDKQIADLKEAFSIALSAAGIDVPAAAGKGDES